MEGVWEGLRERRQTSTIEGTIEGLLDKENRREWRWDGKQVTHRSYGDFGTHF